MGGILSVNKTIDDTIVDHTVETTPPTTQDQLTVDSNVPVVDAASSIDLGVYDSGDECTVIHEDKSNDLPFDPRIVVTAQLPLDEIAYKVEMDFLYYAELKKSHPAYCQQQSPADAASSADADAEMQLDSDKKQHAYKP